jgi:hypothetical protein
LKSCKSWSKEKELMKISKSRLSTDQPHTTLGKIQVTMIKGCPDVTLPWS